VTSSSGWIKVAPPYPPPDPGAVVAIPVICGSNCGRSFWTCANTGGYSCGFFQWEFDDWEPPDSQSSSTDSEDQSCKKCGKVVKVMTVNENNQKGNAGGAVAGLSTNRFKNDGG
jgi:hypothetical protein